MKWLDDIKKKFDFPTQIAVVEYVFGASEELFVIILKNHKGEVHLVDTFHIQSFEDLSKKWETSIPVLILLSGKKVLSKLVGYTGEFDSDKLKAKAYPSVAKEGLVFQLDRIDEGRYVVSAVRQDIVTEILDKTQSAGFTVLDISLGEYGYWSLLTNLAQESTLVGKYSINLEEGKVSMNPEQSHKTEVYGQELNSDYTGAYLYGLQTLANSSYQSESPSLREGRVDWKYGFLFKKSILISGLAVLVILLVNFLLFTHYTSENAELEQLTQAYDKQFKEVTTLRSSFEEKEEFLRINGTQNSRIGRMGDEVAALLPSKLNLSKMTFQPVSKVLKKENLVRFSRDELEVQGESGNYDSFQQWLNQLHKLDWVADIEIAGYQETNSKHQAEFSIKIRLKDG